MQKSQIIIDAKVDRKAKEDFDYMMAMLESQGNREAIKTMIVQEGLKAVLKAMAIVHSRGQGQ